MGNEYLDIDNGVVKGFKQGAERGAVEIPSNVTEIGNGAFEGCTVLESIEIPASVTKIGDGAFMGCTSLETITIPNNVTAIGDWTFAFCMPLHCITIPKSVQSISMNAFSGCYRFIVHYAGTKEEWCSIKGIANNKDLIFHAHVYCSDGIVRVKVVNDLVVYETIVVECIQFKSVKSVHIPEGTKIISHGAFSKKTSIRTVNIPNSVTAIGDYVFSGCTNLKDIHYDGTKADWAKIGGDDCGVPQGTNVHCSDGIITY